MFCFSGRCLTRLKVDKIYQRDIENQVRNRQQKASNHIARVMDAKINTTKTD